MRSAPYFTSNRIFLANLVHSVGDTGEPLEPEVGGTIAVHVAVPPGAERRHVETSMRGPGSRLIDRVAQRHVDELAGPDVPHRGEPRVERPLA